MELTESERPYYKYYRDDPGVCVDAFNQAGYGPDDILLDDQIGHDTLAAMQKYMLGRTTRDELEKALLFQAAVVRLVFPFGSDQARSDFAQSLLLTAEGGPEETIRRGQAIEAAAMEGTLSLDEILDRYQERIFRLAETPIKNLNRGIDKTGLKG